MEIIFLGTGTSHGVPIVGCNCKTCTSNNLKNKRLRSSIFVKNNYKNILIDTTPDLRQQLLKYNMTKVDLVLFTHPHADHIMGFDDLRAINRIQKKEIPCYGNSETLEALKKKFEYIFNNKNHKYAVPSVKLIKINDGLKLNDVNVLPLSVKHNHQNVLGYRINNLAYITDCSFIPDSTMDLIKDVDFLILDALRYKKHPKHFNIEQALEVIKSLNINKAYLTHISHEIEHEEVNSSLPENVELAYDGLKLQI